MPYLTDDQIERKVERMTDSADARLMSGKLTQADYDREMRAITQWADIQYGQRRPLLGTPKGG